MCQAQCRQLSQFCRARAGRTRRRQPPPRSPYPLNRRRCPSPRNFPFHRRKIKIPPPLPHHRHSPRDAKNSRRTGQNLPGQQKRITNVCVQPTRLPPPHRHQQSQITKTHALQNRISRATPPRSDQRPPPRSLLHRTVPKSAAARPCRQPVPPVPASPPVPRSISR